MSRYPKTPKRCSTSPRRSSSDRTSSLGLSLNEEPSWTIFRPARDAADYCTTCRGRFSSLWRPTPKLVQPKVELFGLLFWLKTYQGTAVESSLQ